MNSLSSSCPLPQADTRPLLRVENLTFQYGAKVALQNVSFNLQRGTFHALLGPNGAGKSTLFGLVSRLYRLQQGQILLNGDSLHKAPARVLAQIGMVFQQSTLDLDLSVAENLHYHASLHGMNKKVRSARIEQELARVEMSDRHGQKVRGLNGGHRRRVEIARALLHRPRLLLLDEATVGLDSRARNDINRHVRHLCQTDRIGVLWATHLIEEIAPDDPVTLLHEGRVIADALSHELCAARQTETLAQAFESLTRPVELSL